MCFGIGGRKFILIFPFLICSEVLISLASGQFQFNVFKLKFLKVPHLKQVPVLV